MRDRIEALIAHNLYGNVLRRTETLRPIEAPARQPPVTRRRFTCSLLCAAFAARLTAQQPPRRIVSTAPSITESLFALGLGDQVVGVSRFCAYPPAVLKLPKVGSYLSPDIEAIARLAPDLVVLERASGQLTERLQALRIAFIVVPQSTLDDVCNGISVIAKTAGVPERATPLIDRIKHDLQAVRTRAKTLPSPTILVVVDRRPGMLADMTAAGPGNYLEELLEIAGGTNLLAKPGLPHYPRISVETVLREDPEVIVDLSAHEETEAARQAASTQTLALWARYPQLTAVRKGQVFATSSNSLIVPGPRAPEAAQRLFDYLHPGSSRSKT